MAHGCWSRPRPALQKLEHTNTLQPILEKLYRAETLSQQESHQLFSAVVRGEVKPEQLAAALVSMKVRGEQPQEIAGAATALLENAAPFPRPDYLFADIVGTGGDGSNSINISTASAFVAAACGLKVAKHGNRSVSSKSGSSDLLAAFGINLDMNADKSRAALDELGVCFLFAPKYHTGFRHAMPVRQQLKTRTLFNVLGPLINPAHPPLALIGVYSPELWCCRSPRPCACWVISARRWCTAVGWMKFHCMRLRWWPNCITGKLKAIS